ncbi:hypothetical protein LG3211_1459 [Lysobacter gummosus]|jgi:hypothetical protein|nr:hypothetical protein LG3211_1459 [Lysobacter gummosus]
MGIAAEQDGAGLPPAASVRRAGTPKQRLYRSQTALTSLYRDAT